MMEHPYYGWLGILLKRFLKVKLLIHSHNIEGLRFKSLGKWWWRILLWYEKQVHAAADLSFFITPEDEAYAIEHFKLLPKRCKLVTYGTEQNKTFTHEEKKQAKHIVCQQYGISEEVPLLLYSAALSYGPNRKGLDAILNEISPGLIKHDILYNIIICGGDLPAEYNNLASFKDKHIIYAGFVEDISLYFKAADIFLNPISEGGGIKTKLVEALAANATAISFKTGAIGIPLSITENKLLVSPDNDAEAFVQCIQQTLLTVNKNIPAGFFDHFYWGKVVDGVMASI